MGKLLTGFADHPNASQVQHANYLIEEGEEWPIACLVCKRGEDAGVRTAFEKLITIDEYYTSV